MGFWCSLGYVASCASKLAGMVVELIAAACCVSPDVFTSSELASCGAESARAVTALSLGDCCVRRSISAAFFCWWVNSVLAALS